MSETKLLPCAHCGKYDLKLRTLATNEAGYYVYTVACMTYDCCASSGIFKTEKEAIAAWNRRTAPALPEEGGSE